MYMCIYEDIVFIFHQAYRRWLFITCNKLFITWLPEITIKKHNYQSFRVLWLISCSPLLSFFSFIKASSSSFLSKAHSWWWSSFFHSLFPNGWCLPSPLLLCLPLHLHGEKSPLKDLIEAQISSHHRSSTSKLPSSGNQSTRASSRCSLNLH